MRSRQSSQRFSGCDVGRGRPVGCAASACRNAPARNKRTNGNNSGSTSQSLLWKASRDVLSYAQRPSMDTKTAPRRVARAASTWAASASVPARACSANRTALWHAGLREERGGFCQQLDGLAGLRDRARLLDVRSAARRLLAR